MDQIALLVINSGPHQGDAEQSLGVSPFRFSDQEQGLPLERSQGMPERGISAARCPGDRLGRTGTAEQTGGGKDQGKKQTTNRSFRFKDVQGFTIG